MTFLYRFHHKWDNEYNLFVAAATDDAAWEAVLLHWRRLGVVDSAEEMPDRSEFIVDQYPVGMVATGADQ